MDEEIERLVLSVRADTRGFSRDVAVMRRELDGPLAKGLDRAGNALERGLSRAIRRGSVDFEDLRRIGLSVMADIASAAVRTGLGSILGGGLLGAGASILTTALGLPGRATGGPVTGGNAYLVGERGPEVFVPTSSGRIDTGNSGGQNARPIQMTINVSGGGGSSAPEALTRSSRQVARAVRNALAGLED